MYRCLAKPLNRYGTKEFEVTTERLGCYQPTEHIDNPLGYGEGLDARDYDHRLRGPVDEQRELSINPRTGMYLFICHRGRLFYLWFYYYTCSILTAHRPQKLHCL